MIPESQTRVSFDHIADPLERLQAAADALCKRWDEPAWKQHGHTADYIHAMRDALSAMRGVSKSDAPDSPAQSLPASFAPKADDVLWFMANGWTVEFVTPSSHLTDEADKERAWLCKRNRPPYCTSRGGRVWMAPSAIAALQASAAELLTEYKDLPMLKHGRQTLGDIAAEMLARGVIDVKFTWAPGAVARFPASQVAAATASFLDTYLRGEYTEVTGDWAKVTPVSQQAF